MRARYLGDHDNLVAWGIRFPRGVFVEVTDPQAERKIPNNNHFEVEKIDAEDVEFTEVTHIIAKDLPKTILTTDAENIAFASEEKPAVELSEEETFAALVAEADRLGISIDKRWKSRRLAEEIEKAKG